MQRKEVSSSNLRSIGYDSRTNTLEVEFLDGSIYQYSNVPEHVYDGLMSASSHGQYFNSYVKKAEYLCTKII